MADSYSANVSSLRLGTDPHPTTHHFSLGVDSVNDDQANTFLIFRKYMPIRSLIDGGKERKGCNLPAGSHQATGEGTNDLLLVVMLATVTPRLR